METYPIMLEGALWGKLTVEPRGPKTVFRAECRMREGLQRISVYGGGREGRLGLLVPEEGMLRLQKALSRNDMRSFPERIEFAGPSGLPNGGLDAAEAGCAESDEDPVKGAASVPCDEASEKKAAAAPSADTPVESEATAPSADPPAEPESALPREDIPPEPESAAPSADPPAEPEAAAPSADTPAEPEAALPREDTPPEPEEGLNWYFSPDGALVCFDGKQNLIALPEGDPRIPEGIPGETRTIDGTEYRVFRVKNGRIVREDAAPGM